MPASVATAMEDPPGDDELEYVDAGATDTVLPAVPTAPLPPLREGTPVENIARGLAAQREPSFRTATASPTTVTTPESTVAEPTTPSPERPRRRQERASQEAPPPPSATLHRESSESDVTAVVPLPPGFIGAVGKKESVAALARRTDSNIARLAHLLQLSSDAAQDKLSRLTNLVEGIQAHPSHTVATTASDKTLSAWPTAAAMHESLEKQGTLINSLAQVHEWAGSIVRGVDKLPSRSEVQRMITEAMQPPTAVARPNGLPALVNTVPAPTPPLGRAQPPAPHATSSRGPGTTSYKRPLHRASTTTASPPAKRARNGAGPLDAVDVLLGGDDGPPRYSGNNLLYGTRMLIKDHLASARFLDSCLLSVVRTNTSFYSLRFNDDSAARRFVEEWDETHAANGWENVFAYMAGN